MQKLFYQNVVNVQILYLTLKIKCLIWSNIKNMNFTQTPNKYFDNPYMFDVIGKWSELKITDKYCKKFPYLL
jgi:hypothetical protein